MPQKQITDEQRQQIINLRKRGWTLREIAHETSVSPASVSRVLRDNGVDTNPTRTLEAAQARWEASRAAAYDLLSDLLDDIESLRARCYEPYEQWLNSPDGPIKVTLNEPPLAEVAKVAEQMRRTAQQVHDLQQQLDTGGSLNRTRGVLGELLDGFKNFATANKNVDLGEGSYTSDYDINKDPGHTT